MPYNWDKPIKIREGRQPGWFWIEKSVWNDPRLTASDKVVYGTMAYFANNITQELYPSFVKMAQFSGCSRMQVSRSVKKLEEIALIRIERHSGKINKYTLLRYTSNKMLPVTNEDGTSNKSTRVPVTNTTTNKNNINKNNLTRIKYTSLSQVGERDFEEIASKYQVPVAFVRSKYDDLVNYCGSKGRTYKNYRLALMDWVKRDSMMLRKEARGKPSIAYINPK